ncbi:MAG: hypothetical protein WC683_09760 [bacterium]
MANTLEFVTPALATSLDISSYLEDGTHIPLPSRNSIWAGNITADGSNYITGKYELIPVDLALKVTGATKADLDDNLRAVIAEITKKNILKWQPEGATGPIYYRTYPYDTAEAQTYLSKAYRDQLTVYPFTITLMADPFAWGAEQTISPVSNLVPNWGMESAGGGGEPIADWTKTEGDANAHVTQDTDAGDFLMGLASVNLTSRDADAELETTDYITIDKDKHYCIFFCYNQESGTLDKLTCEIDQYDAGNVIGTTNTFTPTVTALDNWYSFTDIMYPDGTGGNDWDADAAKCKIRFRCNGDNAGDDEVYYVDAIIFTCSEYLSGHVLSNPLGICIPSTAVSGDVPAPCDIYINKLEDGLDQTMGIYIGGRKNYSDDFVPYGAAASGTVAYGWLANQNDYRTQVLSDEILMSGAAWYGGFEDWTGSAILPNFTGWTEARDTNGYIFAVTDAKYGDYALWSGVADFTTTRTNTILSEEEAVNGMGVADYVLSFWYKLYQTAGYGRLLVEVFCYDAGHGATAPDRLTVFDTDIAVWNYRKETIAIDSLDWPAGTVFVKVKFSMSGRAIHPFEQPWRYFYDAVYLDHIRMRPASAPNVLTTSFDLDTINGFVKPFCHMKLAASESDLEFGLQGNLSDGASDITPLEGIASAQEIAVYNVWRYVDAPAAFEIPNVRISDNADITLFDQEFSMDIEGLDSGSTPMSLDDLVLLPIDNGYCAIPGAETNLHYIIDCQSEMPGVMMSDDGSIDKAAWFSGASVSRRFHLDPQEGSNLAILMRSQYLYNEAGVFLADVSIKYRPRFLLAP